MIKKYSSYTKFSIISFPIVMILGLISMGILGLALYESVKFILPINLNLENNYGDETWALLILAGMLWSFGFILAGLLIVKLKTIIHSTPFKITVYIFTLWIWAVFIWYILLV